jgi:hypothetical protein
MKRYLPLVLLLSFIAAISVSAAESKATAKQPLPRPAQGRLAHQIDEPSTGPSDFPTVSKFQMPRIIPNPACGGGTGGDPCNDDGGGGGVWEPGACNCNRNCGTSCTPVTNNQCKAPDIGGGCADCTNSNC